MNETEPLQLRLRAADLDSIVGNEEAVESVKTLLKRKAKPRSWLIVGESGTGKTTLARIIANELGCAPDDFQETNASHFRGVENARTIVEESSYMPRVGNVRVIFLDEAHLLTKEAQNTLLKPLEEPHSHVYWIIGTTNPEKLLTAVKRRCTDIRMETLTNAEVGKYMMKIISENQLLVSKDVVKEIAKNSLGSIGIALKTLDKVSSVKGDAAQLKMVESETGDVSGFTIAKILLQGGGFKKCMAVIKDTKDNPETIRRGVLGYLANVAIAKGDGDIASMMEPFLEPTYETGKAGIVFACFEATCVGEEE
jgi:DNA polymerase-3 subunit gamma/tau